MGVSSGGWPLAVSRQALETRREAASGQHWGQQKTAGPWGSAVAVSASHGSVQEPFQLATAYRVLQLADRLGLDLPHALARHLEDAADLLQRVRVAVAQPVTQLDDLALAVGQRLEHLLDLVLEHLLSRRTHRGLGAVVLDEVAEVTVLALAHGPIQADRVAADLEYAPGLLDA